MKAIWYEEFKARPVVKEVPLPSIHEDAVLLKVKATGLCRSDWHGWMGHDPDIKLPHVPGHEMAGEITQVGAGVVKWNAGAKVTTPFIQACGNCYYCQAHQQQVCKHQEQAGFTVWGSFAEYVEVRYADVNLVEIPGTMSFEEAAVLGCRFGTAYRALVDQAGLMAGQWLAVFGCGGVGLAAILIARALGARVIAIDPREEARNLAASMGADHVFGRISDDVRASVEQITEEGIDITLDAIGSREVLGAAMRLLMRRGRHIQVGLLSPGASANPIPLERLVSHELELYGSHGIQAHRYEAMLQFIQDRKIPVRDLITHQVGLEEAVDLLINLPQSELGGVTIIRP